MHNFERLKVWGKSRVLVRTIYTETQRFPRSELFGIVRQIRRAAVSICCNIAEACGRGRRGEMKQFLAIARGSTAEVRCLILLSTELSFGRPEVWEECETFVDEIYRMLVGLDRSIDR